MRRDREEGEPATKRDLGMTQVGRAVRNRCSPAVDSTQCYQKERPDCTNIERSILISKYGPRRKEAEELSLYLAWSADCTGISICSSSCFFKHVLLFVHFGFSLLLSNNSLETSVLSLPPNRWSAAQGSRTSMPGNCHQSRSARENDLFHRDLRLLGSNVPHSLQRTFLTRSAFTSVRECAHKKTRKN
jgi:hypothetical protein